MLIHKCKKIVKVIHLRVRFNLDVNGLKNSYKGSKVWYYKSGFEDFTLERKYYAYKGIIKKNSLQRWDLQVRKQF